jgi:hypothetical protein
VNDSSVNVGIFDSSLAKKGTSEQNQRMTLARLTSAMAVRSAIEEYDRLGRDKFLRVYGFGTARKYILVYDGQQYDSKAIAGVAHKYQFPNIGPLSSDMFSGGVAKDGAATCLRALGFQVVKVGN